LTCKILHRFFDLYTPALNAKQISEHLSESKSDFLDLIEVQHGLLGKIFSDLESYMQQVQEHFKESTDEELAKLNTENIELNRFPHTEEIRERLNLIALYASSNSSTISLG